MPFIDELLGGINSIICDLQPQQVQTFYEAVGHMISARLELNYRLGHRILISNVVCRRMKKKCLHCYYLAQHGPAAARGSDREVHAVAERGVGRHY